VSSPTLPRLSAATVLAATARAPAPSPRCDARSAAICASVTAFRALHALARGCAHERRLGVCSRWQGPVRSTNSAPSPTLFSSAPSRERAPCRAHVHTTPSGKAAAHSRRSHAAAPRSQVPSGEEAVFTLCSHRTPRHGRCIRESGDDNSRTQRHDPAPSAGEVPGTYSETRQLDSVRGRCQGEVPGTYSGWKPSPIQTTW
jgi:hypothetical protein